jgi:hypothetical protein
MTLRSFGGFTSSVYSSVVYIHRVGMFSTVAGFLAHVCVILAMSVSFERYQEPEK